MGKSNVAVGLFNEFVVETKILNLNQLIASLKKNICYEAC